MGSSHAIQDLVRLHDLDKRSPGTCHTLKIHDPQTIFRREKKRTDCLLSSDLTKMYLPLFRKLREVALLTYSETPVGREWQGRNQVRDMDKSEQNVILTSSVDWVGNNDILCPSHNVISSQLDLENFHSSDDVRDEKRLCRLGEKKLTEWRRKHLRPASGTFGVAQRG